MPSRAMAEFAYRPPRIWVAEVDDTTAKAGPHAFTSREITRTLHVTQQGIDEARRHAWSPSDASSDAA